MFSTLMQAPGSELFLLMALAVIFIAVGALIFSVRYFVPSREDWVQKRLARIASNFRNVADAGTLRPSAIKKAETGLVERALAPMARLAQPNDEEQLGRLRIRLEQAGIKAKSAVPTFLGCKVAFALLGGLSVLWIQSIWPQPLTMLTAWLTTQMTIGFLLPNLWLRSRVARRQVTISRALPDALDLLLTCVDAGLGLDAALNRVAEETRLSAPLLAQELAETAREMRAGIARRTAFRNLARRTGVEGLSNLAAVIYQTEAFGTSVAQALRVQAEGLRITRMQRAEEKAATIPVKLAFPLVLNILPTLLIVVAGPAGIRVFRVFMNG